MRLWVLGNTVIALLFGRAVSSSNPSNLGVGHDSYERRTSGFRSVSNGTKETFLESLIANMTIPELGKLLSSFMMFLTNLKLVLQLHIMFSDNIVGPDSQNELYGQ
jgi:hypothetical protein